MDIDEKYMLRCLQLAHCGAGSVAPNPMVGAVVVHEGRIIGEGFHRRCGEAHAEVNAIEAVKDEALLRDSTLYVSLEPCSHYGKTPPCAELIIRKRIPRVVVACQDPFPEVSGRGVKMLRDAGVEVVTGVLEKEARALNRFFMTAQTLHRPYIILKWAQSADGFIDKIRKNAVESPVHFSNAATMRVVHKLRSEVQAIMVGTNTAILDNPSLTVRHWVGTSPLRILIDRELKVPQSSNLMDGTEQTVVYTAKKFSSSADIECVTLDFNIDVIPQILKSLFEKKIQSLLVEGGAMLHRSFIDIGLWDEIWVESTPIVLSEGVKAVDIQAVDCAVDNGNMQFPNENNTKNNLISVYKNKNNPFLY